MVVDYFTHMIPWRHTEILYVVPALLLLGVGYAFFQDVGIRHVSFVGLFGAPLVVEDPAQPIETPLVNPVVRVDANIPTVFAP